MTAPGDDRAPRLAGQGATNGQTNLNTPTVRRIGCPCGCPLDHHECDAGLPIPLNDRHREASLAAYYHLRFVGLVDVDGFVADVLRPGRVTC